MVDLSRRRVLAALAVTLAGLGFRRAAALPARTRPVRGMPFCSCDLVAHLEGDIGHGRPAVEGSAEGWFFDKGGWAYCEGRGWVHFFQRPPPSFKPATWYGPPPPRPAPICTWDEMFPPLP